MTDDLVKEAREMASTQSDLSPYDCYDDSDLLTKLADRIEELEAELETAMEGLKQCEAEIDNYIRHEYPGDHPVQARYRKRDFDANPARITIAEMKGQDDDPTNLPSVSYPL